MTPDALPPLRETIAAAGLDARKALGQHFLLDLNLTAKIARAAEIAPGDSVLEVGPGPGGLTRALLGAGARVVAIERDARCVDVLAELTAAYPDRLFVHGADALQADEQALFAEFGISAPAKIVSNLPYNISTELLVKWLAARPRWWASMTLMFQKEVADRILAAPGSKTYGRLSVIAQACARPVRAFNLPARAFTPPPKVDSTVVTFHPNAAAPHDVRSLERVTAAAFGQRRKMLRTSLKGAFGTGAEAAIADAGLNATMRAEEAGVDAYLRLAKRLGEAL